MSTSWLIQKWVFFLDHCLDETSNLLSYSNYSLTVGHFNLFLLSEAEKMNILKLQIKDSRIRERMGNDISSIVDTCPILAKGLQKSQVFRTLLKDSQS